jgi:hypothetical protein
MNNAKIKSRVGKSSKSSLPTFGGHVKHGSILMAPNKKSTKSKINLPNVNSVKGNLRKLKNPQLFNNGSNSFGNIVQQMEDVAETTIGAFEGNPISLAKIPNTIMKVVDIGTNVVKALRPDDVSKKITLDKGVQITQENETVVKELSKSMPVIHTSGIPSTFVSQLTLPQPVIKTTFEKGLKITNIQGSNAFRLITYPGSPTAWDFQTSFPMTPTGSNPIFGARCKSMADIFQRWRLNSFSFQYVPLQAATQSGNIVCIANNSSTLSSVDIVRIPDMSTASQFENKMWCHAGSKGDLAVRCRNPWLWSNPTLGSSYEDLKWFYQWVVAIYTYGNKEIPAGTMIVTFDIDFTQDVAQSTSFLDRFVLNLHKDWIRYSCGNLSSINFFRILYKMVEGERKKDDIVSFTDFKWSSTPDSLQLECDTKLYNELISHVPEDERLISFDQFQAVIKTLEKEFSSFFQLISNDTLSHLSVLQRVLKAYLIYRRDLEKKFQVDLDLDDEEKEFDEPIVQGFRYVEKD